MNTIQKRLAGAGILSLLANFFFFRSIGPTGISISFALFNAYIWFTLGKRTSLYTLILTGSSLFFLFLATIRATPFIQGILLTSSFLIDLILIYLLARDKNHIHAMREIIMMPFVLTGSYLSAVVDILFSPKKTFMIPENGNYTRITKTITATIGGLILGIPVVILLLFLFSQADPIFGKTVHDILQHLSLSEFMSRVIGTLVVFGLVVPWSFVLIKSQLFSGNRIAMPQSFLYPVTIVMVLVSITIGAFLMVQWPYVFAHVSAETDLSKYGVATYSEYVKKGFIEFLIIAGLLYSFIWGGLLALRARKTNNIHILQIVQSITLMLFFVFLISIGRRIFLYWDLHGLSLIRIYGGIFLIWVGFLTLLLWARHFFNAKYALVEVMGTVLCIGIVGVWNAESFIVTHHPPTVNKAVDIVYLSRLSSDGYEGWVQSLYKAKEIIETPEYQSKGVLDENDRRQIAYAGIVISQMTSNYDRLIHTFGSSEEQDIYERYVYMREAEGMKDVAEIFKKDLSILQRKGNTATVSASAYVQSNQSWGSELSSSLTDLIPQLVSEASHSSQLASISGQKKIDTLIYSLKPRPARSVSNFTDGTCLSYFFYEDPTVIRSSVCVPDFYIVHGNQNPHQKNLLDKIYTWNKSDNDAYLALKQQVSIEQLMKLQEEYISLWKKILLQPTDKRTVQLDVSFEAPLVDSID